MQRAKGIASGFGNGEARGNRKRHRGRRNTPAAGAGGPGVEGLEGRTLFALTLVSGDPLGAAGGLGLASDQQEVSADGRYVVFTTDRTDLTPGITDTNGDSDVYVRDLTNPTAPALLVSGGADNNAFGGTQPSISADGRFIAFTTSAALVAADTNLTGQDVYVWDRTAPTTYTLVSARAAGGTSAGGFQPSISNDGRFVAFVSSATADVFQVGTTDANAARDVFVRDITGGTTVLISAIPGGLVTANAASDEPEISGNGAAVVFHSTATDLTAIPTGGGQEAYRRVLASPNVDLVSVATPGGVPTGGGSITTVSVSDDGNLVAFSSGSTDIVANDTNGVRDVFVRNMTVGQTNVASTNAAGVRGNGNASAPSLSGDGQFVAFHSGAQNLVDNDTGTIDVYLKNLATGAITRLSQTDGGEAGNGGSTFPSVDLDGNAVAFQSLSTNLAGTEAVESDEDVFAWTSGAVTPGDTTPPAAGIAAANVTAAGGTTQTVTVTYTDNVAVNAATIDAADITVTGPGGPVTVQGVTVTPAGNGSPLAATYTLDAPGGTFDAADNGTYTVALAAGAVTDTAGNGVPAGTGTFTVAIDTTPPPPGPGPDLVVSSVRGGRRGLPPSVVGGSRGQVRVGITNQGDQPVAGPVSISLLARDDDPATPSTADTLIVTTPARNVRLRQGGTRFVPVRFNFPEVPAASYRLVAVVDAGNQVAEGSEANNEGASETAVTIAPPFVDLLAAAVGNPRRDQIAIGRRVSVPVTVENLGNSAASGLLNIDLYASTTGGNTVIDTGDILVGTVQRNLRLRAGQRRVIRVNLPVNATLPPGQYFMTAVINNPATIPETNAANNAVVGATPSTAA
jgi:Tol biopolymer transport system component